MRTILAAIGLAALLMGCDTVEGMRDMKDTQVELKGLIGRRSGSSRWSASIWMAGY